LEIFKDSSSDIQAFVETKVQEFGKTFCDAYSPRIVDQAENSFLDFGKKRLQSAQTLFYKVLELVLKDEMSKKQNFDVSVIIFFCFFLFLFDNVFTEYFYFYLTYFIYVSFIY
jgi:hypothetical protein